MTKVLKIIELLTYIEKPDEPDASAAKKQYRRKKTRKPVIFFHILSPAMFIIKSNSIQILLPDKTYLQPCSSHKKSDS